MDMINRMVLLEFLVPLMSQRPILLLVYHLFLLMAFKALI